jgi:hypothetical protein
MGCACSKAKNGSKKSNKKDSQNNTNFTNLNETEPGANNLTVNSPNDKNSLNPSSNSAVGISGSQSQLEVSISIFFLNY